MVMSAYSAVFLLKLLRSPTVSSQLNENVVQEIHTAISQTADAYQDASSLSSEFTLAATHSRFLRSLVSNESVFTIRKNTLKEGRDIPVDPRVQVTKPVTAVQSPVQAYHEHDSVQQAYHLQTSSIDPQDMGYHDSYRNNVMTYSFYGYVPQAPNHVSELDAHYWKNMFIELGFGEGSDASAVGSQPAQPMQHYVDPHQMQPPIHHQQQEHHSYQNHLHQHAQSTNYRH